MVQTAGPSWSLRARLRLPSGRSMFLSASPALRTEPNERGSDMRFLAVTVLLIGAALLGGCSGGVLDPKGPIASAERLILFNSLGIMLAIRSEERRVGKECRSRWS